MSVGWPPTVYGTNEYTGERVSSAPWLPWKISMLVPRSAFVNGYAMDHSFDANSSFERPATNTRPFENARSVIDWLRLLRPPAGAASGAFGSATRENFTASSEMSDSAPDPSSLSSAGLA